MKKYYLVFWLLINVNEVIKGFHMDTLVNKLKKNSPEDTGTYVMVILVACLYVNIHYLLTEQPVLLLIEINNIFPLKQFFSEK